MLKKIMQLSAREEILEKLRRAPVTEIPSRPPKPPLPEISLDKNQQIAKFTEEVIAQTGVVHRAATIDLTRDKLTEIVRSEKISKIMAASDSIVSSLNLADWGDKNGIQVFQPGDFNDRASYKQAVFEKVEAGLTGVDYGVAESGTLCLVHDQNQARLISLAPILHIAVLPVDRLVSVYEQVAEKVFDRQGKIPSHFTFITGPSMTADIQATMFKGMHGPKKLIIILLG